MTRALGDPLRLLKELRGVSARQQHRSAVESARSQRMERVVCLIKGKFRHVCMDRMLRGKRKKRFAVCACEIGDRPHDAFAPKQRIREPTSFGSNVYA